MSYKEITDIFEDVLRIDFNQAYATRLENDLLRFKTKWVQKDKEHIMMLSSHYTGVYNAVFSNLDMEEFFKIFRVNSKLLKNLIYKLPNMKTSWQVVTNPMYQLCTWLMHKYIKLGYKNLERVLTLLYEIISYPMLTSILFQFFKKRKQTIEEAKAAYEKLNYKFLLKKLGSWDTVIKYKAKTVMEGGRFWEALNKLDTLRSIDIISGIQTSYKSLIINIAGITHTGIAGKIDSSSMIVELPDGTTDIKVLDNASNYIHYINSIITIENDFVDKVLSSIIVKRLGNVELEGVIQTLKLISLDYKTPKKNDTFIEDIITYSIEYLNSKNIQKYNDLNFIVPLKGFWSFGNNKTKPLKDKMREYVYAATGKKTEWVINGLIIAALIFIFARAVIKK